MCLDDNNFTFTTNISVSSKNHVVCYRNVVYVISYSVTRCIKYRIRSVSHAMQCRVNIQHVKYGYQVTYTYIYRLKLTKDA